MPITLLCILDTSTRPSQTQKPEWRLDGWEEAWGSAVLCCKEQQGWECSWSFQKELQEEAWLHSLASTPLVNDAAFSKQTNKSIIAVASFLLMD